jgi:hypothetical protein
MQNEWIDGLTTNHNLSPLLKQEWMRAQDVEEMKSSSKINLKDVSWWMFIKDAYCRNPTLRELWGRHSHSRKWDLGVLRTPKNSERGCRGQNTLHWSVLGTVGKVLKFRCPKWPHMSHLDICSTSYGQKKGRKSNWQFDSRPLKVRNRPDFGACRWSATHHWKALEESYNFGLDLNPIWVRGEELWVSKVPRVQTGIISRLHFGSLGKKSHLDASPVESCKEYYMGEGGGFLQVRAVVNQVSPS